MNDTVFPKSFKTKKLEKGRIRTYSSENEERRTAYQICGIELGSFSGESPENTQLLKQIPAWVIRL